MTGAQTLEDETRSLNIQGEKTGREIELPDDIFGVEPNEHVVYLCGKATFG
jgi:hypothetical protein